MYNIKMCFVKLRGTPSHCSNTLALIDALAFFFMRLFNVLLYRVHEIESVLQKKTDKKGLSARVTLL